MSSLTPDLLPPGAPHRRVLAVGTLGVLVLALHALLLAGLPPGLGGRDARVPVLQVRQIVPAAAPAAPPPPPAHRPPRREPAPPAAPAATATERPAPPAPAPPRSPELPADPPAPSMADHPDPAVTTASIDSAAIPGDAPPTYATRLPPAVTLRYELRRGLLGGEAELTWQPQDAAYELRLDGRAFGLPLMGWRSQGGFDAAGLAPQRFVDRRRGRDLRAANFQRDRGVISYSGPPVEQPLLPGAQDRLSWMLQLAAIAAADPARGAPGDRVVLPVTGARGDADAWVFVAGEPEPVDLQGQRVDAAQVWRRAPRKPYDTQVEVWLDPGRQYLPVRLKLSTPGSGDHLEFVLKP